VDFSALHEMYVRACKCEFRIPRYKECAWKFPLEPVCIPVQISPLYSDLCCRSCSLGCGSSRERPEWAKGYSMADHKLYFNIHFNRLEIKSFNRVVLVAAWPCREVQALFSYPSMERHLWCLAVFPAYNYVVFFNHFSGDVKFNLCSLNMKSLWTGLIWLTIGTSGGHL
jgi:hypothetical protein